MVLLFGTKKLRNIGGDLGGAVKGFKSAMKDGEEEQDQKRLAEEDEKTTANTTESKEKDQA